ncbi:MAG: hypothetical protein HZA95_03175 [Candidatus Vogelbacteria bacterium]|nr:hypothetical protein [Candidatus Vogelbacteria bacterium]
MKKTVFVMFGVLAASAILYGSTFVIADSQITTVSIVNDTFSPRYVTIQAGTSVLWINNDVHYHSVVSNDDYFNSGILYSGNTFQYTFGTPGVYYYRDTSFGAYGVVVVISNSSYQYQNSHNNNYNNTSYSYGYAGYQNYSQTGSSYNYANTVSNQYVSQYAYANPNYNYPTQTYTGMGSNYNGYSYMPAGVASYSYPYTQTSYPNSIYASPQMITSIYYPSSATYTRQFVYNPPALASYSLSNYPYIYPYYTTASYSGNHYKPQNFSLNCTNLSHGSYNYYGSNSYNCSLLQ